jgi:phage-related protein
LFKIFFYQDGRGKEPVYEYLKALSKRKDKDSRIKLNKCNDYIQALAEYGTLIGEPYLKHLEDEIWELRPLRDRILFAARTKDGFVLLHHFMKQTQKTPRREIEQAKRELEDFKRRSEDNA